MVFHLSSLGFPLLALCDLSLQIYVTQILIIVDIELDPVLILCRFLFLIFGSTGPSHPVKVPSSPSILTESARVGFEPMIGSSLAAATTEWTRRLHVLVLDKNRRLSLMLLLLWLFSVPGALGGPRGMVSALAAWQRAWCVTMTSGTWRWRTSCGCGWRYHSGLLHAKVHHFGDLFGLFCQLTEGYVPASVAGGDTVSRL